MALAVHVLRFSRPSFSPHLRPIVQCRRITLSSYLVTPKELHEALKKNVKSKLSTAPRIIPLCATWFLPNDLQHRTGYESFKNKRIPSALFFDLDAVKDHDSKYPHMLPTAEGFAEAVQELGIRKDDEIVVYDSDDMGIFSAPRVGWTFRVFGHPKVHVLNNFKLWVKDGYPTESGEPEPITEKSTYPTPSYDVDMVVKFAEVKEIARDHGKEGSEGIQILDARSKGRWAGTENEPRPGLASGHIPGSISIPFTELLHPTDKTLLSKEELKNVFEGKGVDPSKQIISTCGTGVTAAIIDAALEEAELGKKEDRRLYDGSWT
jgi:thiosulfate/3-mercaptopyruvate sulfurtransferase